MIKQDSITKVFKKEEEIETVKRSSLQSLKSSSLSLDSASSSIASSEGEETYSNMVHWYV